MKNKRIIIFILIILICNVIIILLSKLKQKLTNIENIPDFNNKDNRHFPHRYFTDNNGKVLPIVAVSAPYRDDEQKDKYYFYESLGIFIIGITAYKNFPNKIIDHTEGDYNKKDDFEYTSKIKNWLCCFRNPEYYGFTSNNNLLDMSESDFYNAEDYTDVQKEYDFIYICNKDSDDCPLDGWNAINRNYDLAIKCFPILFNEFKLKGLIVGRIGCGLEELYGDRVEITDFLDYFVLQDYMKKSKFLFVPNIYDASPRVVAECLTKNLPVLMNINIVCGFKYINDKTGVLFSDEGDFKASLTKLLENIKNNTISPREWWRQNYSQEKCQKVLRDFLYKNNNVNNSLENVERVRFIL